MHPDGMKVTHLAVSIQTYRTQEKNSEKQMKTRPPPMWRLINAAAIFQPSGPKDLRGTSTIAASVPNVVATAMSFNTTRIISPPGTTQLHQKEIQCIDSQPLQKNNLICYCFEKFHLSCSPTIQLLRAQSLL